MAVGDPAELDRLAQRVRAEADEVRLVAAWVAATGGVAWRSPAAEVFRERVHDRVAGLRRVAAHVEETADLLTAHARAVATVVGRGEQVAHQVAELARDVWRTDLPGWSGDGRTERDRGPGRG
jgi:hypothetical protein